MAESKHLERVAEELFCSVHTDATRSECGHNDKKLASFSNIIFAVSQQYDPIESSHCEEEKRDTVAD